MRQKRILKITLPLAVVAVAAFSGPVVNAAPPSTSSGKTMVCNEAGRGHLGGNYVATDGDPNPPARFQTGLKPIGSNKGLINAAAHSPALSICVPAPPTDDGGGGTGIGIG